MLCSGGRPTWPSRLLLRTQRLRCRASLAFFPPHRDKEKKGPLLRSVAWRTLSPPSVRASFVFEFFFSSSAEYPAPSRSLFIFHVPRESQHPTPCGAILFYSRATWSRIPCSWRSLLFFYFTSSRESRITCSFPESFLLFHVSAWEPNSLLLAEYFYFVHVSTWKPNSLFYIYIFCHALRVREYFLIFFYFPI